MQFLECQITLIKLPVHKTFDGHRVNKLFQTYRGRFSQCPAGAFQCVTEHENRLFTRLGFGARIPELKVRRGWIVFSCIDLLCGMVKIFDECCSVMRFNKATHRNRQTKLASHLDTIFHMSDNDQQTHRR